MSRIAPYPLYYSTAHFIYGLVSSIACPLDKLVMLLLFILYEYIEYRRIHDYMYYEIREYAAGYMTGVLLKMFLTVGAALTGLYCSPHILFSHPHI